MAQFTEKKRMRIRLLEKLKTLRQSRSKAWYLQSSLPLPKALGMSCLISLSLIATHFSPLGDTLESYFARRLEFFTRHALGIWPHFDSRLKVFGLDTKSMVDLQTESVRPEDWDALFYAINAREPKQILIDKSFALPLSRDPHPQDRLKRTISGGAPVAGQAFLLSESIFGQEEFPLEAPLFHLDHWLEPGHEPPGWLVPTNQFVYGPNSLFQDAFVFVGHTNFYQEGYVRPLVRITDTRVLPHWSLAITKERHLNEEGLWLDGKRLPVDKTGRILVNLGPAHSYPVQSIWQLFRTARARNNFEAIKKGDTVVILTRMHQFDSDMQHTPVGAIPGGFVNLSVLNSVMTGQWLNPTGDAPISIFLFSILGMLAAIFLGPRLFGLVAAIAPPFITLTGLALFCYGSMVVPWLQSVLSFSFTAGILFAERSRVKDATARKLKDSLEGLVDPQKLEDLLKNPASLRLVASVQNLSIMFIDIEGFAIFAKKNGPSAIFDHLKEVLNSLTEVVHRFGGVVDKSRGDGLLCYFGHQYGGGKTIDHAEQALRCAIEIQRQNLERCLIHAKEGKPISPLRIGINAGDVFVGDLGGKGRINLAVIGSDVNITQRLETACDSHFVLCGEGLWKRLPHDIELNARSQTRFIHIKHHESFYPAVEVDPFSSDPTKLNDALHAYRDYRGISPSDDRLILPKRRRIAFQSPSAQGRLVDFSSNGFGVILDKYFGRGVNLLFGLGAWDELSEKLAQCGFANLLGEIRWGRPVEGGFAHGVLIKNLTPHQRGELFQIVRETSGLAGKRLVSRAA